MQIEIHIDLNDESPTTDFSKLLEELKEAVTTFGLVPMSIGDRGRLEIPSMEPSS